jgi:hypothetical protein
MTAIRDSWLTARKEIEKAKIPVHADVAPMEREVQESFRKLQAQGITIPVSTQAAGGGMAPPSGEMPRTMVDYMKGEGIWDIVGENWYPKLDEAERSWNDFKKELSEGASGMISFFGVGSTKKPITEKIQEIIDEFGGLEKALSSMEAEINLAEISAEYKKLEAKLAQVERILPEMSAAASRAGGSPYVGGPIVQTVKDLMAEYTEQMRILEMKMEYYMLRSSGSYQGGISYVPKTGLYQLHRGESVSPRNISSSITVNNYISGVNDVKAIGDSITKILKYNLNQELGDLLKRR